MRLLLTTLIVGCGGSPPDPSPAPPPSDPTAPEGMISIYGGQVDVGSPRIGPHSAPPGLPRVRARQSVWLSPYFIDRTEVTRAEYAEFLKATGYRLPSVGEAWASDGYAWTSTEPDLPDHPVVLVNWYDASEYCRWKDKRLPTDSEWELAALGADGRAFPWGLDDMFGNAWEWTADAYAETWQEMGGRWQGNVLVDPHAEGPSLYRAVRGGSYYFDLTLNIDGERGSFLAEARRKTSGFRCARGA